MTPVFQTLVDKDRGNCMQAVVASLFDIPLEEVPPFIELGDRWFSEMRKFYTSKGYRMGCFNPRAKDRGGIEFTKKVLEVDKGINGYWHASVYSIHFGNLVTHAVIMDSNMNIVHDPNPNNKGHVYKPKDIIAIDTCNRNWHIDVNGKIIIETKC